MDLQIRTVTKVFSDNGRTQVEFVVGQPWTIRHDLSQVLSRGMIIEGVVENETLLYQMIITDRTVAAFNEKISQEAFLPVNGCRFVSASGLIRYCPGMNLEQWRRAIGKVEKVIDMRNHPFVEINPRVLEL